MSGFTRLEESSPLPSGDDHVVPFHKVLGCRKYSTLSILEIGVANWIICLLLTPNESADQHLKMDSLSDRLSISNW